LGEGFHRCFWSGSSLLQEEIAEPKGQAVHQDRPMLTLQGMEELRKLQRAFMCHPVSLAPFLVLLHAVSHFGVEHLGGGHVDIGSGKAGEESFGIGALAASCTPQNEMWNTRERRG
jgi:hypothetical protein